MSMTMSMTTSMATIMTTMIMAITTIMRIPRITTTINLRAAYVHVLADALISILAIAGLTAAWAFGWLFMDPLVGLVGAVVIASWALSLLRAAGGVLLDTVPDADSGAAYPRAHGA